MTDTFIPVNEPLFAGNEKHYLAECIDTGWVSSDGPFVARFEAGMASVCNRRHAIAVSSGTAALEVAFAALSIGPGDEVILPTFTIISCLLPILRCGARPVLVDSDIRTWNMDLEQVEARITPKTRAILAVHIYGLPVDMLRLERIAAQHGIDIIEDAAEVHGQTCHRRPCGSFGRMSLFSFYPNKHVTSGEGGMVLTDDEDLAERCRSLRNLCFQQPRFVHEEIGWNYRMSNLQAAVGLAQLEQLEGFIARKRAMGRLYSELLADLSGLQLPLAEVDFAKNIYWVYGVVLSAERHGPARVVMRKLAEQNIGTRPFFWPMHEQPVCHKQGLFQDETFPVAEKLARYGFYLPSGLGLETKHVERVCAVIHEVLGP